MKKESEIEFYARFKQFAEAACRIFGPPKNLEAMVELFMRENKQSNTMPNAHDHLLIIAKEVEANIAQRD